MTEISATRKQDLGTCPAQIHRQGTYHKRVTQCVVPPEMFSKSFITFHWNNHVNRVSATNNTALRNIELMHLPSNPEILSLLEKPPFPVLAFGQHSFVDGEYANALHPDVV